MMLVDLIMKAPDSYWHKRFNEEARARRRAETDARYYQTVFEQQEKDLALLTKRDMAQARAIEAYNKDRLREAEDRANLERELERERESVRLLQEALRAEREAKAAFRNSALLWESLKTREERRASEDGERGTEDERAAGCRPYGDEGDARHDVGIVPCGDEREELDEP